MLRTITSLFMAFAFISAAAAAENSELEKIQGKWEVKKTSEEGDKITQVLEVKKDAMVFKILNASGDTTFVATATVKPQKAGAFNTFTISNIKTGSNEDSLEVADGERAYVYQLGYQTLTIVSNIDEERERPPTIDVYKKVSAEKK
jgi:hypothetical protein